MDIYDLRKDEGHWRLEIHGARDALATFETKLEGLRHGRDYVRAHGGVLHVWKEDGSLQEERTYLAEGEAGPSEGPAAPPEGAATENRETAPAPLSEGLRQGASDAIDMAARVLPAASDYLYQGAYAAGYYTAYGVVFVAAAMAPMLPEAVVQGLRAGAHAALEPGARAAGATPSETIV
jgi:hypothetical protein